MNDVHGDAGAWLEALRRNSGLALDPEGRWRYGTGFVENDRVSELFHQGLAVREDGEVTLTVGRMWAYVKCEGPALFVRAVRGRTFELLGGRTFEASADTVFGWGPDDRLYLWVDRAAGPARVLRAPHQALSVGLVGLEGTGGGLRCRLEGLEIPVQMLAAVPGPSSPAPAS